MSFLYNRVPDAFPTSSQTPSSSVLQKYVIDQHATEQYATDQYILQCAGSRLTCTTQDHKLEYLSVTTLSKPAGVNVSKAAADIVRKLSRNSSI